MVKKMSNGFLVHRATAPGVGGIALVELLGDGATDILSRLFKTRQGSASVEQSLPSPDQTRLGALVNREGEALDDVLVSSLSASESWCGLSGWSISCHGGPVVTERVMKAFTEYGGELCTTGEILERAVQSGALDFIRQQAYLMFIQAATERASRYFLRQYRGELNDRLLELWQGVKKSMEGPNHESIFQGVLEKLEIMITQSSWAIHLARPFRILLTGRTNVGKSTLFNSLFGQERVIVSNVSGTTRDLIEETIEIAGFPVTVVDSAGLRPTYDGTEDEIERQGIRRSLESSRDAVLFLSDQDGSLSHGELDFLKDIPAKFVILVRTKQDLQPGKPEDPPDYFFKPAIDGVSFQNAVRVSGVTGLGLSSLREAVRSAWLGPPEEVDIPTSFFTEDLANRARNLKESWLQAKGTLDGLQGAFIECFPGVLRTP